MDQRPPAPALGVTGVLTVFLSATVLTSASERSESHRTVIRLHSRLTSGLATAIQLYKMLERSNKSFGTQSTSAKGLVSKS